MSISNTEILVSRYHFPLKEAGPIRDMSDSGAKVGRVLDESGTSFCVRK